MTELAIITGASRGIGLATAARFLKEGAIVWNIARGPCPLPAVRNFACDLSDARALDALLAELEVGPHARITLVHNAAMLVKDNYATLTDESFRRVLELNVIAPQRINRRLIPRLPRGSGILFIGSTLSELSVENRLSYVTSKHALAGLMKATCRDIGPKGLHTCLIAPGFTDTEMLREMIGERPQDAERTAASVILGRLATPEEIAELVFFCSRNPSINGAVLHANLGQK